MNNSRKTFIHCLSCIGIICFLILYGYNGISTYTSNAFSCIPFILVVLYCGTVWIDRKKEEYDTKSNKYENLIFILLGVLFSGFQVIGLYFIKLKNGINIKNLWFLMFVAFCGMAYVFTNLFIVLFSNLLKFVECQTHYMDDMKIDTKKRNNYGIALFLLQIIIWIPYIYCFYPGRVAGDSAWAINKFLINTISDRHPIFYTLLAGQIEKIGMYFSNGNLGIFFNVLLQCVVMAYTITKGMLFVSELQIRKKVKVIVAIVWLLNPVVAMYAITLHTDTFYACFFALFVMNLYRISKDDSYLLNRYIKIFICTLFMSMFRNEGILVCVVSLIVSSCLVHKGKRKHILIITALLIITNFATGIYLKSFVNEENERKIYSKSIMLQQTARYYCKYKDSISKEELNVLNAVVDVQQIESNYNPVLSDGIMAIYKINANSKELREYYKLWFSQFIKHPKTYLVAYINNYYGYLYLGENYSDTIRSGISLDCVGDPYYYERYHWEHDYSSIQENVSAFMEKHMNCIQFIPLIGVLFIPSFYVWLVIVSLFYLCILKVKKVIYNSSFVFLMPSILIVLVCMVSPANGHLRYVFPLIFSCPIVVLSLINEIIDSGKGKKNENSLDFVNIE